MYIQLDTMKKYTKVLTGEPISQMFRLEVGHSQQSCSTVAAQFDDDDWYRLGKRGAMFRLMRELVILIDAILIIQTVKFIASGTSDGQETSGISTATEGKDVKLSCESVNSF